MRHVQQPSSTSSSSRLLQLVASAGGSCCWAVQQRRAPLHCCCQAPLPPPHSQVGVPRSCRPPAHGACTQSELPPPAALLPAVAASSSSSSAPLGFEQRVSEFSLPNGLHFVLLERHNAPVVSCHTHAAVGAFVEETGSTGEMLAACCSAWLAAAEAAWPGSQRGVVTASQHCCSAADHQA